MSRVLRPFAWPVPDLENEQSEQEGVELANACKYGLGAGIWTQDLSRAHRVSADIEAGLVWVNTHHRNDPSSPWLVFRAWDPRG